MESSKAQEWIEAIKKQGQVKGLQPGSENFAWWQKLNPVVATAAEQSGDDYSALEKRVLDVEFFLDRLHDALSGVWKRYENETRRENFPKPRFWWRHFDVGDFFRNGARDRSIFVEVNEDELHGLLAEYLKKTWLRHPLLDWLFLDSALFLRTYAEAYAFRRILASTNANAARNATAVIEKDPLSEIRSAARWGRMRRTLSFVAHFVVFGFICPAIWLYLTAEDQFPNWVGNAGNAIALLLLGVSTVATLFVSIRLIMLLLIDFFFGTNRWPRSTEKKVQEIQQGIESAISAYDVLSGEAIPIGHLIERWRAVEAEGSVKINPTVWALIERTKSFQGSYWHTNEE